MSLDAYACCLGVDVERYVRVMMMRCLTTKQHNSIRLISTCTYLLVQDNSVDSEKPVETASVRMLKMAK